MNCPFEQGDRIFRKIDGEIATVTKITEKGFKYDLDKPKPMIPRWGMIEMGGECYEIGFYQWELYNGKNKIQPLKIQYVTTNE